MKVLWIGDAVISSGFSVVTHNICNFLCKKCDLEVFGIRYDARVRHKYPYTIYLGSTATDIYSFNYAMKVVQETNPDALVIFNDDHIIERYLAPLAGIAPRTVPLFPVNLLPLDKERLLGFSNSAYNVSNVITYTDFSKNEITKINPNLSVHSIYHGVDHSVFFPVPDAKHKVGLKNCFVIGNINANTYRKRLDLFLIGFAKFAKNKPDARCLIHATNKDFAYDLPMIIRDLGIADKVILSNTPKDFSEMNMLYNLMDVNVNTSLGEGFGLSLVEGAACGVPVLCPEHGNLTDIWGDNAVYIKVNRNEYIAGTTFVGGVIDVDSFVLRLEELYEDRTKTLSMSKGVLEYSKTDRFNWGKIADKVYEVIRLSNSGKISYIS